MSRLRPRDLMDDERGAVAVVVALMMTVLCLAGAYAIDLGHVAQLHKQAQTAVDDAALSGASLLTEGTTNLSTVVSSVEAYVQENYGSVTSSQWNSCDPSLTPSGYTAQTGENCITFNSTTSPKALNVILPPQAMSYTLANAGGLRGRTITASATASASGKTGGPCALCVLGQTGTVLSASNGSIKVNGDGEGIMVDSTDPAAMATSGGNVQVSSNAFIDVAGNYAGTGYSPNPVTGVAQVPDPLAFLPDVPTTQLPSTAPPNVSVSTSQTATASAAGAPPAIGSNVTGTNIGYYNQITVPNNGTLNLQQGVIYIITGGISLSGNASLQMAPGTGGVLLYFTCGDAQGKYLSCGSKSPAPNTQATMTMQGTPVLNLSGYTAAPYAGMTMFMDRNNTSTLQLQGNPASSLAGTIYAKSGGLSLLGNAQAASSLVVVKSMSVGNSISSGITINYDPVNTPSQNVLIPTPFLCSTSAGNC